MYDMGVHAPLAFPRALGGSQKLDPPKGSIIYTIRVFEPRIAGSTVWILPRVCMAVFQFNSNQADLTWASCYHSQRVQVPNIKHSGPKTMKAMVLGTRDLKSWVLGPSGIACQCVVWRCGVEQGAGVLDFLGTQIDSTSPNTEKVFKYPVSWYFGPL